MKLRVYQRRLIDARFGTFFVSYSSQIGLARSAGKVRCTLLIGAVLRVELML